MPDEPVYTRRGPRIGLAAPREVDREAFLALRRASAALHARWEPAPAEGADPYGVEAFAGFLARARRDENDCLLVWRLADTTLVGAVNLSQIVRGALQSAYIGYWVGEPFTRQGYMTEALGLAVARAFETLGLHRLEANIQPDNGPSLALAARLGFVREGFSPRYLHIAGAWRDHVRTALLADDWLAARGAG